MIRSYAGECGRERLPPAHRAPDLRVFSAITWPSFQQSILIPKRIRIALALEVRFADASPIPGLGPGRPWLAAVPPDAPRTFRV
jgi:hypothetical protein